MSESLVKEINRRRGEMAGLREHLSEHGITEGTLLQRIDQLLIYKKAMDSMAAQILHPKITGLEMARMQLEAKK